MTKYELICDTCGSNKVVKNLQECIVEYDYDYKTEKYSDDPTFINDPIENKYYCQKCYDEENF